MKSLRWRLTLWFAASLLVVVGGLAVSGLWHLDHELRQEKWERTHPAHPDWILHGSFTDQEVQDILGELARFWLMVGVPLVVVTLLTAHWLARKSTRPVREVNQQLARLGASTLAQRITAPDADPEIAELVRHFNGLLARLETSFNHLGQYASQVAHELRTPLQLMRLRIETDAASLKPELAEELQEELARLSAYVETALTIARAEQGGLEIRPESIRLGTFLEDVVEPFIRLAATEGRPFRWECSANETVWTDRNALKQILFNLLTNALKHGEGEIRLRVRRLAARVNILIGNRCPTTRTSEQKGLGIGLRLVHALVGQLVAARVAFRCGQFFWARLELPADTARRTGLLK